MRGKGFFAHVAAAAVLLACMSEAYAAGKAEPLRVLILSGRNNHDWRKTTPVLEKVFLDSGRFVSDTIHEPNTCTAEMLARYDVVASNWCAWPDVTGRQWGPKAEKAFLDFVRSGKGFALFHAASATFHDWPEYQQMVGATWKLGTTGHGTIHAFKVSIADANHPVTSGMPDFWIKDELWHRMGTQPKINVLCRAFSSKDKGGSGLDEPAAIWSRFGKGRCFYNILGHDEKAMRNSAWRALMLRGTEWAATGKVTIGIPEDWPGTAEQAQRRYDEPPAETRTPPTRAVGVKPTLDTARGILNEFKARRLPIDKKIEYCGLDLTNEPATSNPAELGDLYAADANDPNRFRLRAGVVPGRHRDYWCEGVVYDVPAKGRYYIAMEPGHPIGNPYFGPYEGSPWKKLGIAEPNAPAAKTPSFGIYLVLDAVAVNRPDEVGLDELHLTAEPVISDKDLLAYDWDEHILKLAAGVKQRIPSPSVWGAPFVVVAGGERCYLGAFWTIASSYMPTIPMANVGPLPSGEKDTIRISPSPVKGARDVRNDRRVRKALEALGPAAAVTSSPPAAHRARPLAAQLQVVVDMSHWRRETTLGQAIDDLKNSVNPPLRIIVLWRDLYENAGIDRQTAIGMDGIANVPAGAALKSLLMAVTGRPGEIGCVEDGGVITIATKDTLKTKWQTRVYDMSDLL
ncbi:MAG: ThuA domain-containing protein [Sedimentisphaerales bacterium]|nr:ThuA domain-containing protein [Sedimentisphaerales bacterium]